MNFLHKNIVSFEPKFFGLDLSDLSLKIFQIERIGKFDRIRSFCSLPIARGNMEDGKIINKEKIAEIIRQAVKKAGPKKINTCKVICSLPESNIFLRVIHIPKIAEKEANQAIKWEMEANIPLPIEEVYLDWQFLEGDPENSKNKQSVLTVAVSRKVVDDFMETLELSGLEVYDLEIESIASARSLVNSTEKAENISLIVDIGARRTSFIMVEGNVPCFTSSIPFSSENINDAIAKKMNINSKEAEEVKIAFGIENFNKDNPIFNSIKYLLENLVTEIEKTIDFYVVMSKIPKEIKKIILCGGGSNLKGLVAYLAQRIGKEVVLGDPLANLNLEKKELDKINKENCIGYATVIGLAIKKPYYGN
jgi:type IV pilus assembly protein PilM